MLGLINLMKFNYLQDPVQIDLISKLELVEIDLNFIIHQIVQKTNEIESMTQE